MNPIRRDRERHGSSMIRTVELGPADRVMVSDQGELKLSILDFTMLFQRPMDTVEIVPDGRHVRMPAARRIEKPRQRKRAPTTASIKLNHVSDTTSRRSQPVPMPVIERNRPVTVASMAEDAAALGYVEVYAAYRYRKRPQGDRLLDCLMTADTLEGAVKKLIVAAGFDREEVKALGLDKFGTDDLEALYAELNKLTGDTYEISPYEQPILPAEDDA